MSLKIGLFVFVIAQKSAQIDFPFSKRNAWPRFASLAKKFLDRGLLRCRRSGKRFLEKRKRIGGSVLAQQNDSQVYECVFVIRRDFQRQTKANFGFIAIAERELRCSPIAPKLCGFGLLQCGSKLLERRGKLS